MLCSTIENFLPNDYFTPGLKGLLLDLKVFDALVALRLPLLTSHFEKCLFDLSMISLNWFVTLYVTSCPLEVSPFSFLFFFKK